MDGKASNEMEDQTSTFLNNLNSHAEPDDDYDESEPLYADDLPYSSSTTSGARATLQGSCISRPFNISALKSHVIIMMRDDGNGRRRRQRCYDYANTIMKNLPCYLCITAATLAFASILDSTWFQDNDGNGIISSLIIKTGVKSSVKYAGTRMNNNFPTELLGTVYSISDFDDYYDKKRIPYWDDLYELIRDGDWPASLSKTLTNASNGSSSSSMETSFLKENDDQDNDDDDLYRGIPKRFHDQEQWGPCYPYHNRPNINWRIFSGAQLIHTTQPDNTSITSSSNKTTVTDTAAVLSTPTISYPKKEIIQARQNGNNNNNNNNYYINHLQKQSNGHQQQQQQVDTSGMCRPGFLIIGAGKCGTSSLYHYLTDGHPRILPAVQKQIGYFTYYSQRGMQWYLSHFPTSESFLSSGALITGEAFPGYLPYTNVANDISKELPGVRIITIVREPIARAYSSYNYNYVRPALSILRRGQGFPPSSTSFHTIPKKESDAYYKDRHLFSFEEMVRAELSILKECLSPGGLGEAPMKKVKYAWAKSEYKRRNELGLPSLMDVERCYGGRMDRITPRAQWSELVKSNPEKIIDLPDLQLSEAVIGRGMYVLSLEWWYAAFATEDLHIVCLEELDNIAMNEITAFLGLPATNFTKEMELGRYNVAGHKGYNKLLTSDEMDDYDNSIERDNAEDVPLSNGLLQELEEFLKPYNERLFQLMGRRCKW